MYYLKKINDEFKFKMINYPKTSIRAIFDKHITRLNNMKKWLAKISEEGAQGNCFCPC